MMWHGCDFREIFSFRFGRRRERSMPWTPTAQQITGGATCPNLVLLDACLLLGSAQRAESTGRTNAVARSVGLKESARLHQRAILTIEGRVSNNRLAKADYPWEVGVGLYDRLADGGVCFGRAIRLHGGFPSDQAIGQIERRYTRRSSGKESCA